MEENKQLICELLLQTLQETRDGSKLTNLIYNVESNKETVTVIFRSGGKRVINVTADSGVALIYDVIRQM